MAENKTKPTDASVEDYIASRANEEQRADCKALMSIFKRITEQQPKMWGPSIVGYGSYRYTYESGRTGEMCLAGFAIRGRELVVYILPEGREQEALLSKLGKHKMGKSCLYFKRLADLDKTILEQLIASCVLKLTRRYGPSSATQALDFLERQKGSDLTEAQAEDLALEARAWARRPIRKRTRKAK